MAGMNITNKGFVKELVPFVIGVTGKGRCAAGTLNILKLLPHENVKPEDLSRLVSSAKKNPEKFN